MALLTKRETAIVAGVAAVIAGVWFGGDALISSQKKELAKWKEKAGSMVEATALAKRLEEIKRAKDIKGGLEHRKAILAKAEEKIPAQEKAALSYEDVYSSIPSNAEHVASKKGPLRTLAWEVPRDP